MVDCSECRSGSSTFLVKLSLERTVFPDRTVYETALCSNVHIDEIVVGVDYREQDDRVEFFKVEKTAAGQFRFANFEMLPIDTTSTVRHLTKRSKLASDSKPLRLRSWRLDEFA